MANATLLKTVKTALRITRDVFDVEINGLIDDCILELRGLGITVIDAQTTTAVIAYCKWLFGSNPDADKWRAIYEDKVKKLQTRTGYGLEYD